MWQLENRPIQLCRRERVSPKANLGKLKDAGLTCVRITMLVRIVTIIKTF